MFNIRDIGSHREIFRYADHITVSTQAIAEYARQRTDVPITVIPNSYFEHEWDFKKPDKKELRIGFSGSSTHVDDLLMVLPSIVKLQKKYNFTFLINGFGKDTYESWLRDFRFSAPKEGDLAATELDKLMKQISFEWIPYIDFDVFPKTLIEMNLDIGICPLKDTPFNNCRSAGKALEYTLAGALALASDTIPYRSEPTSILVKDTDWEEQLEYYILHPDIREKARLEHLTWLRENRNIESPKMIDLLKSVYVV
jgi:hypothetical protein